MSQEDTPLDGSPNVYENQFGKRISEIANPGATPANSGGGSSGGGWGWKGTGGIGILAMVAIRVLVMCMRSNSSNYSPPTYYTPPPTFTVPTIPPLEEEVRPEDEAGRRRLQEMIDKNDQEAQDRRKRLQELRKILEQKGFKDEAKKDDKQPPLKDAPDFEPE